MKRAKNTGVVWRPIEYMLIVLFVLLVVFLVWAIREINNQNSRQLADANVLAASDDEDISSIVERSITAEEAVDRDYDAWERRSRSSVDSAADDIGSVYDETAY